MTDDVFAWNFPGGRLVQTVTSVVLVNNTTKTVDVTVPEGERWLLFAVKIVNDDDVDRVFDLQIFKEVAKTNFLRKIMSQTVTANGGKAQWPIYSANSGTAMNLFGLVILENPNTLQFKWVAGGASAGSTDADGLVYEYLKVEI